MKRKKGKKIAALAIALCIAALPAAGCGKKGPAKGRDAEAEIWTMPSTIKVLRDEDYSAQYTASPALVFETAKNEYESAQLFITPDGDIDGYTVTVSDLTDGAGNVLAKDNIDVYHEKCVEIVSLSQKTSGRPLGYYPDPLIPFAAAVQAGETNIKKGQNQGVWFTLYTPKDAVPGTYTGSVTVAWGNKSKVVPVSVTVWDFAIPDKSNIKTTYHLFDEYLMGGELDNTPEMYEKYVDYMLDYRISTTVTVCPMGLTEEKFVDGIKKYAADERCTSYKIGNGIPIDEEKQVKLLVENSTPELNLLEKAIFYPYDEPHGDMLEAAKQKSKDLVDMLIRVANGYTDEQLSAYGLTKADIRKIPVLITYVAKEPIDGLRTYCPLISEFNTEAGREKYETYRKNAYLGAGDVLAGTDYGTTWWYTCGVSPREPWTTFVIDEDLVGSRVLSWMQHEYGIDGFLYWGIGSYFQTEGMNDSVNGWRPADIWNVGNSVIETANGDGYIVYPGAKYGLSEPIPTLRLMSIRDGYEDYEYLYKMQALLDEYGETYATDALANALDTLYASLYSGTIHKSDYELVLSARRTLAGMLSLAETDAHAFVSVGETDGEKAQATIEVFAQSGATLTVGDGEVQGVTSGDGVKFTYTQSLANAANSFTAKLTHNGVTTDIDMFVSNKVVCASDFETEDGINAWSVSKRANGEEHLFVSRDTEFVKYGMGSMKIESVGKEWSPEEREDYSAHVILPKATFLPSGSVKDIDGFELYVYNPSDETVDIGIDLLANDNGRDRSKNFASFTLEHGWNKLRVTDVYKWQWTISGRDILDRVTGIALSLPLTAQDVTLYVDAFSYTCR